MNFVKSDLAQAKNLVLALKKAKFNDLEGMEVLAFSQLFGWVGRLHDTIEAELKATEQAQLSQQKAKEIINQATKKTAVQPSKIKKKGK